MTILFYPETDNLTENLGEEQLWMMPYQPGMAGKQRLQFNEYPIWLKQLGVVITSSDPEQSPVEGSTSLPDPR